MTSATRTPDQITLAAAPTPQGSRTLRAREVLATAPSMENRGDRDRRMRCSSPTVTRGGWRRRPRCSGGAILEIEAAAAGGCRARGLVRGRHEAPLMLARPSRRGSPGGPESASSGRRGGRAPRWRPRRSWSRRRGRYPGAGRMRRSCRGGRGGRVFRGHGRRRDGDLGERRRCCSLGLSGDEADRASR